MTESDLTPTATDAMSADAAPREFPKDAPALVPYLRLPFRKRAKFFRGFGELQEMQEKLSALDKKRKRAKNPSQETLIEQATLLYELYGSMDDLMRVAAVDTEKYEEWVETHSDDEFQDLFSIYVERSQPGEASSSAS